MFSIGVLMVRFPQDDDVIAFNPGEVNTHPVHKVKSLNEKLRVFLQSCQKHTQMPYFKIFSEGHRVEVMTTDSTGWRKATLKLVFKFEFEDEE